MPEKHPSPSLPLAMILSAMAGGMAWGIRGQYGHETGAMIAGILVGLVIALLFAGHLSSLTAARAVAWMALGISIGGSMTYGQTVGLTHDGPLIGNWAALRWGLLGLAVKGGLWIGFGAALLGMGLGGKKYSLAELSLLLLVMLFLLFLGVQLLNMPYDPQTRELPTIYFSDHWDWEPDSELKPRRERWGGLLTSLLVLVGYVGWIRGDRLARRLALWGFLGGAVGFPLGQSLQAWHAWQAEEVNARLGEVASHINWWNMMETTFGAVFGGILALGVWLNRHLIGEPEVTSAAAPDSGTEGGSYGSRSAPATLLSLPAEWLIVLVHVAALTAWQFGSYRQFDLFADLALTMTLLPILAVAGGRVWPYLMILPIVALPIAGKTFRQLVLQETEMAAPLGAVVYVVIPLAVTTIVALWLCLNRDQSENSQRMVRISLLLNTWLYFGLNYAFFHFPWPWREWTGRTPNGLIFLVCAVCLTLATLLHRNPK